jgi:alpha-glucoside transport system substrate-binding protein
MDRHMNWLSVGVVILLAAIAVACAPAAAPTAVAPTAAPTMAPTAVAPTTAASQSIKGAHVSVLGVWGGSELDNFTTVKQTWEKDTGGIVDWEGTRDLTAVLTTRVQGGNPPDIAILPNPGLMQELAQKGKLVPLDSFMDMNQVKKDYTPAWLDLGSYNGKLYAIFYKAANKATVWYNPKAFAASGYAVPKAWDEWMKLADKMVADGKTPFSIAAESGAASGWPLSDWISEIVLNNCGPDTYDKWITHQISWTDACIKQSFETFGKLVGTKGYVLGGSQGIVATNFVNGTYPMYTTPPTAYMDYLGSFAQGFIATQYPKLKAGDDYNFFPFPTINSKYQGAVTIGADVLVMLNDTPAARSFMTYLAGAKAQEAWVKLGGFTAVNRSVSLDAYPDPVARAAAQGLTEATISRFGAGDMMPAAMQQAWWKAMLDFVKHPNQVDTILNSLESTAKSVYSKA